MVLFFYFEVFLLFVGSFLVLINNLYAYSILAFILGMAFTAWTAFCVFSFFKKKKQKALYNLRKTLEYAPFVLVASFIMSRVSVSTNLYTLDAILSLNWVLFILCNFYALHILQDKRVKKYFAELPEIQNEKEHSILFEILDWIDAIVQAICIVLLFTLFVVQLYVIPSESMVPEFMIGDRVMGVKLGAGPGLPLSSYRFPSLHKYRRGDIVIIRNPHYEDEPDNEIKFFGTQVVQYLTLTMVNINRDDSGKIKADPLVKRVVAVEDEKVMLVDGKLYIKKAGERKFKEYDESAYATWDISALPKSELQRVHDIRMDTETLNQLESVESLRAKVDFKSALKQADELIAKMKKIKNQDSKAFSSSDFLSKRDYLINQMLKDNQIISAKILDDNGGVFWFEDFLKDWSKDGLEKFEKYNLYEKRNAQLNILIKLAFGKLFIRNAELYRENISDEEFENDDERNAILSELESYLMYVMYSRSRNMNEFPVGEEEYIPKDCFFMMGDNRFNSTDMRHDYQFHLEALDNEDNTSILFVTNVKPRYIHKSRMLGTVNLIIYPFSRFGSF